MTPALKEHLSLKHTFQCGSLSYPCSSPRYHKWFLCSTGWQPESHTALRFSSRAFLTSLEIGFRDIDLRFLGCLKQGDLFFFFLAPSISGLFLIIFRNPPLFSRPVTLSLNYRFRGNDRCRTNPGNSFARGFPKNIRS